MADQFPTIDFDFETFQKIEIKVRDSSLEDFKISTIGDLITPYLDLISTIEDSSSLPPELLLSKAVIRQIKIPGLMSLMKRDPISFMAVLMLIGMFVASILEEKKLEPYVVLTRIQKSDLLMLKKEVDLMVAQVLSDGEQEINRLHEDYEQIKELITESEEDEDIDSES